MLSTSIGIISSLLYIIYHIPYPSSLQQNFFLIKKKILWVVVLLMTICINLKSAIDGCTRREDNLLNCTFPVGSININIAYSMITQAGKIWQKEPLIYPCMKPTVPDTNKSTSSTIQKPVYPTWFNLDQASSNLIDSTELEPKWQQNPPNYQFNNLTNRYRLCPSRQPEWISIPSKWHKF